jgi:hypothetical protein
MVEVMSSNCFLVQLLPCAVAYSEIAILYSANSTSLRFVLLLVRDVGSLPGCLPRGEAEHWEAGSSHMLRNVKFHGRKIAH